MKTTVYEALQFTFEVPELPAPGVPICPVCAGRDRDAQEVKIREWVASFQRELRARLARGQKPLGMGPLVR